jgi:hypothetical protein
MAMGAGIVEGLSDKLGLAAGAQLKGDRGIEGMSRSARTFTDIGHMEHITTGRARMLGKQDLKVKIPHP